ncbi:hypothetical protein E0T50_000445 [Enterococcus faecalis]|nr:hypothetical protein [Enterococcus faecalis]EIP8069462.1 hypothetical protein [Enterococcus faecalis]
MKAIKLGSVATVLGLAAIMSGGVQAFAWEGGVEDPNTTYTDVKKQDEATIPAVGQFKQFDPRDPSNPDPENPTDWIDISVPVSTDFAQTDATPSGIVAPTYKITNNSAKGVKIGVKDFVDKNQGESAKVPELKLDITNKTDNITVPLVNAGQPVVTPTEFATLDATGKEVVFSYSGNVGSSFQYGDVAVSPSYELVLQLEAIK